MNETVSKARSRLIARLRTRHRAREGRFLVEGVRTSEEVLAASIPIDFAVVSPRLGSTPRGEALASALREAGVELCLVTHSELRDLADTETPQGIVLVCPEPVAVLDSVPVDADARFLILDGIQDPGNLGTLVRAAAAFDVRAVLLLPGTTDPWSAKAVRASAGALLSRPVVRCEVDALLRWIEEAGVAVWVGDARGVDVAEVHLTRPWALVMGNEGNGVSAAIREIAAGEVGIPMPGGVESLNAGVAGSILLHALSRPMAPA